MTNINITTEVVVINEGYECDGFFRAWTDKLKTTHSIRVKTRDEISPEVVMQMHFESSK